MTAVQRRQAGRDAFFAVGCAAAPDAAPTATVYAEDGTVAVAAFGLPPKGDPADRVFGLSKMMTVAAGRYLVRYAWAESAAARVKVEPLVVLPGGDASGGYANLTFYEPPHARFVVGEREDGTDEFRRNPRL